MLYLYSVASYYNELDQQIAAELQSRLSDELFDRAFEPFYRAESSRESTKGHGLGLSIVRRLARQFGWQISAVSRPAEGTSVEIRFEAVA